MGGFWGAVGGAMLALLVAVAAHQATLGGRRRRQRREIREELEILALMHDWPDVRLRLQQQVNAKLQEYAPVRPRPSRLGVWVGVGVAIVGLLVSMVAFNAFEVSWQGALCSGAGVGLLASVARYMVEHEQATRRRRRDNELYAKNLQRLERERRRENPEPPADPL